MRSAHRQCSRRDYGWEKLTINHFRVGYQLQSKEYSCLQRCNEDWPRCSVSLVYRSPLQRSTPRCSQLKGYCDPLTRNALHFKNWRSAEKFLFLLFCTFFHVNFSQLFVVESQMCAKFTPNALQLFQTIWNVSQCQSAKCPAFCDCRLGLNMEEGVEALSQLACFCTSLYLVRSKDNVSLETIWNQFLCKDVCCVFILRFFSEKQRLLLLQ